MRWQAEHLSRRDFLGAALATATVGFGGCRGLGLPTGLRHDPSLTAFLSDCHVCNWHGPDYQGKKFAEAVARVLRCDPLPARLIIPGDLAYLWGRKEDYALAKKLLQPVVDAGIEVGIAMGNHDRRENFLEFWPEYADRTPMKDKIISRLSGPTCDFILIDTLVQPEATDKWITPGELKGEQREWLDAECKGAKRPYFVVAHHPAKELGVSNVPGKQNPYEFGKILLGTKDAPRLGCGFIHGHDHRWYVTRSLISWADSRIGHTAALPSTGHWGDIGYALLTEEVGRATLKLEQYDYFSPAPLEPGKPRPAVWDDVIADNRDARCTFAVPTAAF